MFNLITITMLDLIMAMFGYGGGDDPPDVNGPPA